MSIQSNNEFGCCCYFYFVFACNIVSCCEIPKVNWCGSNRIFHGERNEIKKTQDKIHIKPYIAFLIIYSAKWAKGQPTNMKNVSFKNKIEEINH